MTPGKLIELLIQHRRPHLQKVMRSDTTPAHVLSFTHAATHDAVDRRLDKAVRYLSPCLLPAPVVDQGVAIGLEIAEHIQQLVSSGPGSILVVWITLLAQLEQVIQSIAGLSPTIGRRLCIVCG